MNISVIIQIIGLLFDVIAGAFFVFELLDEAISSISQYHKNLDSGLKNLFGKKEIFKGDKGFKELLEVLNLSHKKCRKIEIREKIIYASCSITTNEIIYFSITTEELLRKQVKEIFEKKRHQYGFMILLIGFILQVIGMLLFLMA